MKILITLLFLLIFTSCTIITPNTGLGVSVQPVVAPTLGNVYYPTPVYYPNYWPRRHFNNNFYRPTVRVNINPPRRYWNGPRGGRRN